MAEQELEHSTSWGRLCGTLVLPEGDGPWPGVLLIAGSGPTDRNGNNPLLPAAVDNLKRLAGHLAGRGIASLRYDKRGVGASVYPGLDEQALRFEQLVDDAVLLSRHLAADARIAGVTLAGHSEGALIAALAAAGAQAQAVVSIAGAGERASTLMRRQIEGQLPPDLAAQAFAALASLEARQPVDPVPEELALLFRPSVQPYLISWFRHDPPEVLARLGVPVLLVHGSLDAQVGVEHARLLLQGRPDARLRIVEGMDHLLSLGGDVPAGTQAVAVEVADWMQELELGVVA